jgi:hypothetical protein
MNAVAELEEDTQEDSPQIYQIVRYGLTPQDSSRLLKPSDYSEEALDTLQSSMTAIATLTKRARRS